MTWTVNKRNCFTIYTHPNINSQVIVNNSDLTITWANIEFDSVEQAKRYAEDTILNKVVNTEYPT